MYRFKYWWLCFVAWVNDEKCCPYCLHFRKTLRTCPTCGVAQCEENCYGPLPPDHTPDGDQCGACDYPT